MRGSDQGTSDFLPDHPFSLTFTLVHLLPHGKARDSANPSRMLGRHFTPASFWSLPVRSDGLPGASRAGAAFAGSAGFRGCQRIRVTGSAAVLSRLTGRPDALVRPGAREGSSGLRPRRAWRPGSPDRRAWRRALHGRRRLRSSQPANVTARKALRQTVFRSRFRCTLGSVFRRREGGMVARSVRILVGLCLLSACVGGDPGAASTRDAAQGPDVAADVDESPAVELLASDEGLSCGARFEALARLPGRVTWTSGSAGSMPWTPPGRTRCGSGWRRGISPSSGRTRGSATTAPDWTGPGCSTASWSGSRRGAWRRSSACTTTAPSPPSPTPTGRRTHTTPRRAGRSPTPPTSSRTQRPSRSRSGAWATSWRVGATRRQCSPGSCSTRSI